MPDVQSQSTPTIHIGRRTIGPGLPSFVIAEIGNNHNGSFDRAITLIDAAIEAGADCAKFQMRRLDSVYRAATLSGKDDDLSVEYTLDILRRFELSVDDQCRLAAYCIENGILYMCTPWDPISVGMLQEFGVEAFKVASADLTNLPLLGVMAATGKPLIVSTGMSTSVEIKSAIDFLTPRALAGFVMLHCQSTYPAAFQNINMRFMGKIAEMHPLVGYSGHERGIAVSQAAVALGACVIERHITLDRTMEGPDHAASLEPAEFKQLVLGIREIEAAMGSAEAAERSLSQGELINRENLAKSLVASRPIVAGTIITEADIQVRSPGQGLSPLQMPELIGHSIARDLEEGDYFIASDLTADAMLARRYNFSRPWGVPVRYHDVEAFLDLCDPDLIEFHLSYQDMERNPSEYLRANYDKGLVIHAPELFSGSRLMDLATFDEDYRQFSLRETQRVIDITRSLKQFFPNTARPPIVANIGGFSMDKPISAEKKLQRYDIFARSLSELDCDGIDFIPQTMAPFPWHFGGQRYQNIFIFPEEIAAFCDLHDMRICFDVAHTALAANHFGFDLVGAIDTLGPYIAHIHYGDARGVDGEGLQVGEGDIDFVAVGDAFKRAAPAATFIPEIWQGHKNRGEGFWIALDRLEGTV
ncbi:MAG: N-acetylneuraminate synthase family protein [Candidatus Devosia symbiotica]|nr:N-acetylneuraminate synthase family protein [Candidatus Devosia symbiotica]